jgi:hypothetical protein
VASPARIHGSNTSSPPVIWYGWPNCFSPAYRNRRGRDARRESARKRCGPRRFGGANTQAQPAFATENAAMILRTIKIGGFSATC